MSVICIMPIVLPAAIAAWPAVAAAAVAATAALGYQRSGSLVAAGTANEVEVPLENAEAVAGEVGGGQQISFVKDDLTVTIFRNDRGQVAVKVGGPGRSQDQLRQIGQRLGNQICQQYAYHRLVTELKERNFNVASEEVEEDGTVRLQVRIFQG